MRRSTVLVFAGWCLAVGVAACSEPDSVPSTESTLATFAPAASTDAAASIVRVIPRAFYCAARRGGGPLVVVVAMPDGDEEARVYASWNATAFTPLVKNGLPWPSASRDGIFFFSGQGLAYLSYDGSVSQQLGYTWARRLWASPSGGRLLLERETGNAYSTTFVDQAPGGAEISWEPPSGSVGEAVWTSETELFVQLDDSPPDGGIGSVWRLSLSPGESTSATKLFDRAQCPSPDPTGTIWAYGSDTGELVLCDPVGKREIMRYVLEGFMDCPPAWCDETHLALGIVSDSGPQVVILDCGEALSTR